MSEFKVGDRVRIREDLKENEEYDGTWVDKEMLQYVGKIATIKWNSGGYYRIDLDNEEYAWVEEFFDIQHEVIALKNDSCEIPFENNPKIKTQEQIKIDQLEQRIEKLEEQMKDCIKYSQLTPVPEEELKLGGYHTIKGTPDIKLCGTNEQTKPSLLTEDERVILRNLDKEWKWIARDNNNFLSLFDEYKPFKGDYEWKSDGKALFLIAFSHLFQFIKFEDKPYNIEELLKGDCGDE